MKRCFLISMLFMYLIYPIFAEEVSKMRGKIGDVWIQYDHVFFTVCQGENVDLCEGVYLHQDHKLFQPAYTAIMNAKAMNSEVIVFGEKVYKQRTNFVKMKLP